jgi:hypothetical protein
MTHLTRAECLRAAEYVEVDPYMRGCCWALKDGAGVNKAYSIMSSLRIGLGVDTAGWWWPEESPQSQAERCLFLCFLAYAPREFRRVG